MINLNLGCGRDIRKGFVNMDIDPVSPLVTKIDLNILPLPFNDGSVDMVLLSHVLEHLDINHLLFMKEIYRIVKENGVVTVCLPVHCNVISHRKMCFNQKYFNALEEMDLFHIESFDKSFKIKDFLWKIKELCMTLFFSEYSWVLRKKGDDSDQ